MALIHTIKKEKKMKTRKINRYKSGRKINLHYTSDSSRVNKYKIIKRIRKKSDEEILEYVNYFKKDILETSFKHKSEKYDDDFELLEEEILIGLIDLSKLEGFEIRYKMNVFDTTSILDWLRENRDCPKETIKLLDFWKKMFWEDRFENKIFFEERYFKLTNKYKFKSRH